MFHFFAQENLSLAKQLEKSSVSPEVDRLVERGWVVRSARADSRSQRLGLAPAGRLLDAALPSWEVARSGSRDSW